MLSNAYLLAKIGFDTAENETAKNLQNFRKMHFRKMHFSVGRSGSGGRARRDGAEAEEGGGRQEERRKEAGPGTCAADRALGSKLSAPEYAMLILTQS